MVFLCHRAQNVHRACIKELKCKKLGIELNGTITFTIRYADDQVTTAQGKEHIEYIIQK